MTMCDVRTNRGVGVSVNSGERKGGSGIICETDKLLNVTPCNVYLPISKFLWKSILSLIISNFIRTIMMLCAPCFHLISVLASRISDQSWAWLWFIAALSSVSLSQAQSSEATGDCQLLISPDLRHRRRETMKCNALGWQLSPSGFWIDILKEVTLHASYLGH